MQKILLAFTIILLELAAASKLEVDLSKSRFPCDVVANVNVIEDVIKMQSTPHKVDSTSKNGPYDPLLLTSYRIFMNISSKRCHEDLDSLKYQAHKAYLEHRSEEYKRPSEAPGMIVLRLTSTEEEIVRIERRMSLEPKKAHSENNEEHWSEEGDERQIMYLDVEQLLIQNSALNISNPYELVKVVLTAQFLGRSTIFVDILWMNTTSVEKNGTGLPPNKPAEYVGSKSVEVKPPHYNELQVAILASAGERENGTNGVMVTVLLYPSIIYTAFDWGAVTVVLMLAFSVGTCTNPGQFADKMHKPMPIIAGTFLQTVSMPLITLGIVRALNMGPHLGFGQLVVAALPGGGLAHLLVFLVQADRHLSAALSFSVSLVTLMTGPLWILGLGQYVYGLQLNYLRVIGWIALVSCTQFLAIFIRRVYPDCAKAILTWITRPLLLLSAILMVTLGIYINHYIIHHVERTLIISLLLEVSTSFLIGWIVGYFFGEGLSSARTLSTEAAFCNGLLSIVILRTGLHAPDGDLAAMAGFWMTFIMPIAGVFHAMIDISTDTVKNWMNKKNEESSDESDDLGATSMAAISAASVAVTPAIANLDKKGMKNGDKIKEDDQDEDPLKSKRLSRQRKRYANKKTADEEINYALLNQSIGASDRTCQMFENESRSKKSNSFCVNTSSCKTEMV